MNGTAKKAIISLVILIIFGGFGTYLRGHEQMPDSQPDFSLIPFNDFGYTGSEHRFDEFAYEVLKADTSTLRNYFDDAFNSYWLFVAYFSSQKYGAQIHSPRHCLPGGGFKIETIELYPIKLNDGTTLQVNRLTIANNMRKELMIYWFETRGGVISDEYGLKLDLMRNAISLQPTDAAFCRLTMPLSLHADFDKATERAVKFIRDFYPSMQEALPFDK
ncbi:MAG: exosortase C-terminal domain/associated protein EpsI [candidate division Zixibacteria bacterium]